MRTIVRNGGTFFEIVFGNTAKDNMISRHDKS
jgi:hypothetical protein